MKIICFGDSLTACGGERGRYSDILQDRFPGHAFLNKGVGGETFVDALARLQVDILDEQPDVVIVEFGANDWWRDERPCEDWARDLETIVSNIKRVGGAAIIVGVFGPYKNDDGMYVEKSYGIDPRGAAYRALEAAVAAKYGCPYVANIQEWIVGRRCCWEDTNHPNEYGNRSVADAIEPHLSALLGVAPRPVRKATLHTTRAFWQEAVMLAPHRLAVVDGTRRLTYAEADALVERLAAGLADATGTEQPKVAVYLPNCLEYYLIYWAVQKLGGAIVPLNTWLKAESLEGIFRTVQPDALFVRSPLDEAAIDAAPAGGRKIPIFTLELGGERLSLFDELLHSTGPAPEVPITPETLSIIMHTSGTTATPKGAMMRHADLLFNVQAAINAHGFTPADVHLLVNPMFHCTALYSSLPTAAYQKAPVVIVGTADPEVLLRTVEKERITTFLSVPTVFQKILSVPDLAKYDTSSLRVMAYAGSPMPVPVIKELRRRFPDVALHNFFGLTETISMTHVLRNADVETRPDSIGRLLPFVDAIVVDDQDRRVPPGTPGELLFAREEVIPGYYKQPERLREAIAEIDGRPWFRTGDLALVDDEGYWYIKGRKKDMIIVGGENVFAAEVEAVLQNHPLVREAAVKGIPATGVRAALGELVKAYIVPRQCCLTEAEIKRHCFDHLPSYKVPQIVTFLDALPRNPSGKVVKDELP
jgi:fatty-acyl-CoA synthase